jgi:cytochrome oxidase Cu insertion factor (SCO1/SenC/PrrC family)
MRAYADCVTWTSVLLLASTVVLADVGSDRVVPPDEERFVNVALPNVALTTAAGARVNLASIGSGRPLLLAFVFTRCTGVCSPFLLSWRAADQWLPNRVAVQRLVVSFDPRDSAAAMAALARHLGVENDVTWTFAVAAPEDVRRLAEVTGFWYDWDPSREQFDHPALLAAVRNGRLVRLLVGGTVGSGRLNELMREASGEFVPSYPLPGRFRFRCVQYDPRTGSVSLDWGFALLLVPVGTVGLTTAMMFSAGGRVRRRQKGVA